MYSEAELAELAGTTVERIGRMTELRILAPEGGGYRPPDIQLVRVAEALDRAGIELSDIGRMITEGVYSMAWADLLYPDPVPPPT